MDGVHNVYSYQHLDEMRRCKNRSVMIMCRVVVAVFRETVKELLTEMSKFRR